MTAAPDPNASIAETSATSGGTTRWMAPELLFPERFGLSRVELTRASNIYALGMVVLEVSHIALAMYKGLIIFQVLTGNFPFFECKTYFAIGAMVVSGERPTRPAGSTDLGLSDQIWQLLTDCWSADRLDRPDVTRVRELLQEAVPVWTPPPASGFSEDVGDDGSEFDWTDPNDTVEVPLGEGAQDPTSNVSITNTSFDNFLKIVQDMDAIIRRNEGPVSSNNVNDEDQEIRDCRESLNRRPPGHLECHSSLHELGVALIKRFRRTGGMEELEELIRSHRQSLELSPPGHLERHRSLDGLGEALVERFRQTGGMDDLEELI
jgi:serine/threonine protein kinase